MNADMRVAICRFCVVHICERSNRVSFQPSFSSTKFEVVLEPDIVEHVFHSCLLAIGAVTRVYEDTTNCASDVDTLRRESTKNTRIPCEVFVAGNASQGSVGNKFQRSRRRRVACSSGDATGDESRCRWYLPVRKSSRPRRMQR